MPTAPCASSSPWPATSASGSRATASSIAPGHNLPEIERIIERTEGYWVIEKEGAAGELAEELDPRA